MTISDKTVNDLVDSRGETSVILLSGRQLTAARRKLTAAVLRRPSLLPSVVATGFRPERDLDDADLVSSWKLAPNTGAVRLLLPTDQGLRDLYSSPPIELDSRSATALARQIKRSVQAIADKRKGRYLHLPEANDD